MKRTKLASIWVDTASILIGDPCQLLADDRDVTMKVPSYDDLMYKRFGQHDVKELPENATAEQMLAALSILTPPPPALIVTFDNRHGGTGAVCVDTGSDGYYPVYMEYDKDNKPVRLVIELGGKVKP